MLKRIFFLAFLNVKGQAKNASSAGLFYSSEGLFGIQKEVTTKNDLNAISKKVSFLSAYWDDAFLTDDKRVAEPCFKTLTSKKSEEKTSFFCIVAKK